MGPFLHRAKNGPNACDHALLRFFWWSKGVVHNLWRPYILVFGAVFVFRKQIPQEIIWIYRIFLALLFTLGCNTLPLVFWQMAHKFFLNYIPDNIDMSKVFWTNWKRRIYIIPLVIEIFLNIFLWCSITKILKRTWNCVRANE